MVEDRLRLHFDYCLGKTEIVIYSVLAVLLAVTAFVTIATAGQYFGSISVIGRLQPRLCGY